MYLANLTTILIGYPDWNIRNLNNTLEKWGRKFSNSPNTIPDDLWPMEKIWLTKNYRHIKMK